MSSLLKRQCYTYSNIGEQKGEGGQYFNNYLMRKKKVLYCNMFLPFEVRGEGMREDDGRRGCGMWMGGGGTWVRRGEDT